MISKRFGKIFFGLIFFAYWAWSSAFSLEAFINNLPFGWEQFSLLLIPEIILALFFCYFLWPGKDSPDVSAKFLSVFSILIVVVLWIVGPFQSFFTLDINHQGISFSAFLYSFEALVFGSVFLYVMMRYLRKVREFLADYASNIKTITKERTDKLSEFLSGFPLKIARIGFFFTFGGYFIATPQLIFIAKTTNEVALKSIFIGLAISPILALLMYIFARHFLSGVFEILYSFGNVARPKLVVSVGNKIMILSFFMLLMVFSLLFPLAWNFHEDNISSQTALFGFGAMLLEILVMYYISARVLTADISRSLDALKKGLEILQTGERRYQINTRTGDEMEEVIDEFNKVAEKVHHG